MGWQLDAELRQDEEDRRTIKVPEFLYLQYKDIMFLGLEAWRRVDTGIMPYYEVTFPTREQAVQAAHYLGVALPPSRLLY